MSQRAEDAERKLDEAERKLAAAQRGGSAASGGGDTEAKKGPLVKKGKSVWEQRIQREREEKEERSFGWRKTTRLLNPLVLLVALGGLGPTRRCDSIALLSFLIYFQCTDTDFDRNPSSHLRQCSHRYDLYSPLSSSIPK